MQVLKSVSKASDQRGPLPSSWAAVVASGARPCTKEQQKQPESVKKRGVTEAFGSERGAVLSQMDVAAPPAAPIAASSCPAVPQNPAVNAMSASLQEQIAQAILEALKPVAALTEQVNLLKSEFAALRSFGAEDSMEQHLVMQQVESPVVELSDEEDDAEVSSVPSAVPPQRPPQKQSQSRTGPY